MNDINSVSIGIELDNDGIEPYSQSQIDALLRLPKLRGIRRVLHIAPDEISQGDLFAENVRRLAKEQNNKHLGYNVITGEYGDMLKAGVIDPLKVVRGALENAASIAAMILTTECLITDVPEKEKPAPMPPGGGMDY